MAEEQNQDKPVFKPVEVDFTPTGEFEVRDVIEEEEVEEQEEEQEEEVQENDENEAEESEEVSESEEQDDAGDSGEGSEEVEEGEEEAEEVEEEDDFEEEAEEEVEEEENEVVDYNDLPDSIQAALDFMEETGGSLQDFMRVNRDFDSMSQDQVISEYMLQQYPDLDAEDIAFDIEERFAINEDDTEREAKQKRIAKKKYYNEALRSLKEAGEKYKAELGSSTASPEAQQAIKFRQDFERQQAEAAKAGEARRSSFIKETNKVFGKNFKGFEIQVGDETVHYKPENVKKVKEQNLNVNNLLGRFTDKEGNVTDAAGYHKALSVASDPDAFADYFYELGKAAAIEEEAADSKNVSKGKPRQTKGAPKSSGQPKFRLVDIDGKGNKKNKGLINFKNY
jgi:hypothetical protein